MSDYRLIAFDMDGTLLNSRKIIPEENLAAIKKATESGKIVILSTGRCLPELEDYVDKIPNLRYVNCLSGACVYDVVERKTIFSAYIDVDTALEIIDTVEERDVMMEFLDDRLVIQKNHFENIEKYGMGVYRDLYDKNTIAVGDADNDIGIFKKAGLKIAMDNANSTIKGLSDVVVPDCDNGGCVVAIEKYLL